ncbi:MAG: choice-of-anchor D domain-containing protein, partial [Bacteroidetes bacterium]|nr:choice-of-anchor D domain-containing protein [Bacteroidota bacterium]
RESVAITTQPKDTAVQTNLTAKFSVTASGTDAKYQWMKNGANRPGDTLSTLTIANVKLSDSGNYKCVVKNLCGSLESAVAKLTVTAPPAGPALALSISAVDFGCNKVKTTKDSLLTNVVFNGGGLPLNVTAVTIKGADAADFAIVSGGGSFTLAPNEKHTVTLRFTASTKATKSAVLEFTSNSSTTAPTLALTGKGCSGMIESFTAFAGTAMVGTSKDTTIKICNTGDFDLVVTGIAFAHSSVTDFSIGTIPMLPTILKPNDCLTIPITFTPTVEGMRETSIVITTDEGEFSVAVNGTGTPSTGVDESIIASNGVTVYPNPSSGNVIFSGEVSAPMPIKVRIFDGVGNYAYQTTLGIPSAGTFNFTWDGTNNGNRVSSGNYTALLSIGTQTVRVPFVIVR